MNSDRTKNINSVTVNYPSMRLLSQAGTPRILGKVYPKHLERVQVKENFRQETVGEVTWRFCFSYRRYVFC